MAFTTKYEYRVEVTESDEVLVRRVRVVLEDDVEISRTFLRRTIQPGDDYAAEVGKVRRMCSGAHVPTVITLRQTREAYQEAKAIRDADPNAETQAAVVAARDAYQAAQAAHEAFLASENP